MKRTISIKLKLTPEQIQALNELQREFSGACNFVADIADREKEYNRVKLHHLSYYEIRKKYAQLGAQMACNAVAKVAHALKALKKKKRIVFKDSISIHFDKRTYTLKGLILSLFTLQGRIKLPIELSPFHVSYLNQGQVKEAELIQRGKRWFFNLVLDLPDQSPIETGNTLAIDFGENNLAATSTGKLFGGGTLKAQRDKFLAHRSRLQSNGSQSAKQRLRKISGKERRHVKYINHCVSKKLVEEAVRNKCATIALEDLTNILSRIKSKKKVRSRLHRWPFDELRCFVEYKAQAKGMRVVYMNPSYTSQTCSNCLAYGKRSKHRFNCLNCDSYQHSDLNASQNLLRLALSADSATGDVSRRHVAV
jgi:putative transposase